MAKSNASGLLTSLDSLFTTQEQRDEAKRDSVQDIPISQISDFPEHPFKVKQDEAMLEMAESVRQYGVLVPGLVRQLEDGSYQMIRRAEKPQDYFATFDCFDIYKKFDFQE